MSNIILYIATSLDGFIARKNGSVDWLDQYDTGTDHGYTEFLKSVDTILMGSTTYEQILCFGDFPYKGKDCYVFSSRLKSDENVTVVNGDVKEFLDNMNNKRIWLVGGADLIQQVLIADLIDEFMIFIMPTILGEGKRLFRNNPEHLLKLFKAKSHNSGAVLVHYKK